MRFACDYAHGLLTERACLWLACVRSRLRDAGGLDPRAAVIALRHDSHAWAVTAWLRAGSVDGLA